MYILESTPECTGWESAGYGMEFRADHDMEIATITIGYADGFPRALSKGRGAAVLIGKSGDKEISACDLAEETGTITNEILSRLGARLERVVI